MWVHVIHTVSQLGTYILFTSVTVIQRSTFGIHTNPNKPIPKAHPKTCDNGTNFLMNRIDYKSFTMTTQSLNNNSHIVMCT